jgi:hypothetical protein
MTKASIVQRLLDEKQITAEEAVVLLLQNDTQVTSPLPYTIPINPMQPYYPSYPGTPYIYGSDSTK